MKEYIVTKNILNIRSSPNDLSNDNFVGELLMGTSVFLSDTQVIGTIPRGGTTPIWKPYTGSNFLAADGLRLAHCTDQISGFSNLQYNYNAAVNVPDEVKKTRGYGVTVAVIDTGCLQHPAIDGSVIATYDVTSGKAGSRNDNSVISHGTFISGMIAGGQTPESQIIGIAPLAKLVVVKCTAGDDMDAANILKALNWLLRLDKDQSPDIINMSLDVFAEDEEKVKFSELFKQFKDRGTMLIAAGQIDKDIYGSAGIYPAGDQDIMGAGAILLQELTNDPLNQNNNYIVPKIPFLSAAAAGGYSSEEGSSMSSAILSGIYALFLSYKRATGISTPVQELVDHELPQFKPIQFTNTLKIYKR